MIAKKPCSCLRFFTQSLPLESSKPSVSTTTITDHKTLCFSLADKFIKRGLISSAQGVLHRIITKLIITKLSSSIPDIFSTINFATQRELPLNSETYSFLIRKLVNSGQPQLAQEIYSNFIIGRGVVPSPSILQSMIICYSRLGKLSVATAHFDQLVKTGVLPSKYVYDALLRGLCTNREKEGEKTELCLQFMDKMIGHHECKPSVTNYNSLIKCLCKDGRVEDAKWVTSLMKHQCLVGPNLATYLIMVYEHCKRGDTLSAFDVLDEMDVKGMKPSVAIYDSIIGALCREKRLVEAENMFKRMIEAGVAPDGVVYATMINGYSNNGRAIDALMMFDKMLDNGIRPSFHAYTALINVLVKKNMTEKGCQYLVRMLDDGFVPDTVFYTVLINQSCKNGELSFAFKLADLMDKTQIKPNVVTLGSLVSGVFRNVSFTGRKSHVDRKLDKTREKLFSLLHQKTMMPMERNQIIPCKSSKEMFNLGLKLVQVIKENGLVLDLHIHNAMINGYCRMHRMQDAYDHLELMQKNGLGPNQVTYTILIEGCIRFGEINRAVHLFNEMNSNGCVPDKVAYNVLIRGLCSARRVVDALSLVFTMNKRGLFPSKASYERLLKSLCDSCSSDYTFKLFEEMIFHGYVPCRYNYNQLLCILYKANKLCMAHKLFDMMLKRGKAPDEKIKRLLVEACYKQREFELAFMLEENILVYKDG